jgi:predicted  nucleic acid-binding Zn-ribbon protein
MVIMDKDTIDDLKQFIATIITQQTSDLREDISEIREDIGEIREDISGLKNDVKELDNKIDNLSDSVGQALNDSNEETDKQLKDHETRIGKLETKTA